MRAGTKEEHHRAGLEEQQRRSVQLEVFRACGEAARLDWLAAVEWAAGCQRVRFKRLF